MKINYSTPLMNAWSETSIKKNVFTLLWKRRVLSYFYGDITHFSKQQGTFFTYGDIFLNSFNKCMQWNLNPTKTSSHFSKQCGFFFKLWRQILLQWTMWYLFLVMERNCSIPLISVCNEKSIQQKNLTTSVNNAVKFSLSEQCGTFYHLLRHITKPLWLLYAVKNQPNKNVFQLHSTS